MENKKLQTLFEGELLDKFVTRKSNRSQLKIVLKAKNDKEQGEWLLREFFNTSIAPLCNGIIVAEEVKRLSPKEKMYFAASVIDKLYCHVIKPYLVDPQKDDIAFFI
jgi:hypothetical protein